MTESERLLQIIRCRCKVTAHDGCWTWQGATTGVHPQMSWKGRGGQMVRRLAYEAHFGVTLGELRVSPNNCGNVLCVNPEHLTCWSRSEHLREQHRSGSRSTPLHYIRRVAALKRKGRVKLDLEKAREIRASEEPCKVLAARYEVHHRTISAVRCGRIWRDINALGNVFAARTLLPSTDLLHDEKDHTQPRI